MPIIQAYDYETSTLNNVDYDIYKISEDELPINIQHIVYEAQYQPQLINNSYWTNATNTTNSTYIENITQLNWQFIEVTCTGEYIHCRNYNITEDTNIHINISIPKNTPVEIYESQAIVHQSSTILNDSNFRFFINYGANLFEPTNVLEYNDNTNPNFIIYNAELPYTTTKDYEISTRSNETLTIRCTNMLICNTNQTSTSELTRFTATLTVPSNTQKGIYTSRIELTTSYNKSLNITYTVEVREAPIQVLTNDILTNKEVANMTPEELMEFFDDLNDYTNEAIDKLEAANKTTNKEKTKVQNVTVPYLANKDEIVAAVIESFYNKNEDMFKSLTSENEQLASKQTELNDKITKLSTTLQETRLNSELEKQSINQTIYQEHFVIKKSNIILICILCIAIIIIPSVLIYNYKKNSWGALG